jgi:4-hydroxy-tetrahydrodipicolinate reductase
MGQAILSALAGREEEVQPVAALVRPGAELDGQAVAGLAGARTSGLAYRSALPDDVAVRALIDFSHAGAFDGALELALQRRIAFVSGTTGIDARQRDALGRAAASIPVLWAANFSLGVALLSRLVAEAARALPDWDCEIAEAHHRRKQDAPSGTALALGREVAVARGEDFDRVADLRSDGTRGAGSIGFAVTRAGDIVGEHSVLFATSGERIELAHRATDRMIFARGALAAALWLAEQPAGRYALADMFPESASPGHRAGMTEKPVG